MSDKISIVLPTRNRVHLLRQALRCATAQSWPDKEIVVVDEASTDGTAELLAREFPDVRVVRHEASLGPGAARNVGIATSQGDWVFFWDDDDLMHPTHLEALVGAARAAPAGTLASGRVRSFGVVDGEIRLAPLVCAPTHRPGMETLAGILHPQGRNDFTLSTLLWPRILVDRVKWDEELSIGEDVDFFGRAILAGWRIVGRPVGLHYIRLHPDVRLSTERTPRARLSPALYRLKWSDLLAEHPQRAICAAAMREGFMALLLDLDDLPQARELMPLLRDHFHRWGGQRPYVTPPPRHWLKRLVAQGALSLGGPRALRALLGLAARPAALGVLEARFQPPQSEHDRADAAFLQAAA